MPLDGEIPDNQRPERIWRPCPVCHVGQMAPHYGYGPDHKDLGSMECCDECNWVENFVPDTGE